MILATIVHNQQCSSKQTQPKAFALATVALQDINNRIDFSFDIDCPGHAFAADNNVAKDVCRSVQEVQQQNLESKSVYAYPSTDNAAAVIK